MAASTTADSRTTASFSYWATQVLSNSGGPNMGLLQITCALSDHQRNPLESLLAYCHMCPRTNHSGETGGLGTQLHPLETCHDMFVLDPLANLLKQTAR
ncbi:hypothetical protein HaLaN_09737 [Haematococcus lacustris]|uniref:Uncharacterized protein n=1 Tax=Haematococcus lacustris TaxID=44745 RepID=A0A699YVM8_HAELA|nr:hypothetical protein HaLaN_09737 [Haematococcus lacustris]